MVEIILDEVFRNILVWFRGNLAIVFCGFALFIAIPIKISSTLKIKRKRDKQALELAEALEDDSDNRDLFTLKSDQIITETGESTKEKLSSNERKLFILTQDDLIPGNS